MMNNIFHKENKKFDKNLLTNVQQVVSSDDLSSGHVGRIDISSKNALYECFIKRSEKKYLIVFLSAAGRTNQNTAFHRINWSSRLDANLLYIEDPMYKKYKNLRCGWYYGNEKENYLDGVLDIVGKVLAINAIDANHVIFVGASSAGYAALYCANNISGSMAYAVNPQIILKDWRDAKNFQERTGINLDVDDDLGRNNIKYIQKNKESKFFILYNSASSQDKKQIGSWLDELRLDSTDGLKISNNLYILIQGVKNHNPHVCVAGIDDFITAIGLIGMMPDISSDSVSAYLNRMKDYVLKEEEAFYSKMWFDLIRGGIPDFLEMPEIISKFHIDFKSVDYGQLLMYRIFHQKSVNASELVLYVKRDQFSFDEKFIKKAREVAAKNSMAFKVDEKQDFLRFSRNFKKIDQARDELFIFISQIHLDLISSYTKIRSKIEDNFNIEILNDSDFSRHMQSFLPWLRKFKESSLAPLVEPVQVAHAGEQGAADKRLTDALQK